ncbi:MAG: type II 3-dehydroquinate dehydratase [Clostridiales bacterium]|nr:type II 3-dehydroquinate dehydratase [Clostridiales bacterium]
MKILILNGPNLNLLGIREPSIYGKSGLNRLIKDLDKRALALGVEIYHFQSNSEGALIDQIHEAREKYHGIIFNPGAFTHYSYALRDAISAVELPVIEVHISNISARESFRNISVIAPVCLGQISGLGLEGYGLALEYLVKYLSNSTAN